MSIYEKVLAYLREHGFSRQLTYENFTILPPDRRRGLFVHVMPGQQHFCVCQLAQVVKSGGTDIGSESFAFLSVREGDIDALELRHEAGLRAIGAELVEYEATLAVQPVAEDDDDEVEGGETDESEDGADETDDASEEEELETPEFDADSWSHALASVDATWPERIPESERLPYLKAFTQLTAHKLYKPELLDAVAVHVARCVPEGFASHGRVWAVSAMNLLTKGFDDVALLGVQINGFSSLELVATASGSGQSPLLVLLTIQDGRIDEVDMKALKAVEGFQFLKASPEAEELGFVCIGVPSLEALAKVMRIPGVIYAARLASIRMTEQKPSKKRPQPSSNLAVLDAISARPRPAALGVKRSDEIQDYVSDRNLDACWLPDEAYGSYMTDLAYLAVTGDPEALRHLVCESNRTAYRDNWALRLASWSVTVVLESKTEDKAQAYQNMQALLESKTPEMVAMAVLFSCKLAPAVDGKPFATPLSFLRTINGRLDLLSLNNEDELDANMDHNREGAVFMGVLSTCDFQVMPMLESAWHRLSRQAQIAVFELRPFAVSFAYVDFVLARLREVADSDDRLCGTIIRHLQALPVIQSLPVIDDRLFWFNEPQKENLYATYDSEHAKEDASYAEYLRDNREIFDEIAAIENKPRLMPELIREWRQLNKADLERRRAEAAAAEEESEG